MPIASAQVADYGKGPSDKHPLLTRNSARLVGKGWLPYVESRSPSRFGNDSYPGGRFTNSSFGAESDAPSFFVPLTIIDHGHPQRRSDYNRLSNLQHLASSTMSHVWNLVTFGVVGIVAAMIAFLLLSRGKQREIESKEREIADLKVEADFLKADIRKLQEQNNRLTQLLEGPPADDVNGDEMKINDEAVDGHGSFA